MFELTERQKEVIEGLDWRVIGVDYQDGTPYLEIENWSPAGEDLCETIWINDGQTLAEAARDWADSFDKDDHVELWVEFRGKRGVPRTARELVEDADAIQDMFNNLADALEEAEPEDDEDDEDCEESDVSPDDSTSSPKEGSLMEFTIPFNWKVRGTISVTAKTLDEAIESVKYGFRHDILRADGDYLVDTLEVDPDIEITVKPVEKEV